MMKSDLTIQLCSNVADETVEQFLKNTFGLSKNQMKKHGLSKAFLVKMLRNQEEVTLSANLVNHGRINPIYIGEKPRIIFEDNLLLACSKPAGIHCHPLTYLEHDNMLSFLAQSGHKESLEINRSNYDRGLMYRLDKETSGLVVFIKNQVEYTNLRKNFHELVDEKIYYAVVSGVYDREIDLQTLLKTSGKKGRKIVEDEELNADTKFSRLEIIERIYNEELHETLLKIKLFHGHRHQIRAQLRACGFPIKGDSLYSGEKSSRLYLHCSRYKFRLGDKEYDLCDDGIDFLSKFFDTNG